MQVSRGTSGIAAPAHARRVVRAAVSRPHASTSYASSRAQDATSCGTQASGEGVLARRLALAGLAAGIAAMACDVPSARAEANTFLKSTGSRCGSLWLMAAILKQTAASCMHGVHAYTGELLPRYQQKVLVPGQPSFLSQLCHSPAYRRITGA